MKATSSLSPATEYPVTVDRRTEHSCNCKWEIQNYQEAECISSPRFEVGGFAFRFLMYPKGDDHNFSGDHFTLYIYIDDPRGSKSDCFVSFKVTFVNQVQESMSSRGVFSSRFNREDGFLGLADYESYKTVLDPKSGFLSNGSLLLSVDICILDETTLLDDKEKEEATSSVLDGSFVSNGKFTWMIKNYSLFKEMIKAQKIISPAFHVGDSSVALGLKTSVVHGVECLALFLEIKDKRVDQSCWFMFKIAVLNKKQGHMHRDSCGRIGLDSTSGGDAKKELTYGWNDYMRMSDFIGPDEGFLVDDTVTLSVSFNAIQDSCSLMEIAPGWKSRGLMSRESDLVMKCDWENKYMGRFEWRIEKFKRLKDRLKRKKNKGLCVRSKRFQIGNQDFRLLVYPRGQAENPIYLSMFLEVSDAQNTSGDQNCFVNYRLSVVNQKNEDKSVTKESQDRCSKATKDWGWSEFMTLTSLFGQDTGYILEETAVFAAEVRILKETLVMRDITVSELRDKAIHMDNRKSIKWKMENFLAFKEIMATQKMFSKSFMVGECKLRIGVYVSVDIIYAYLEFDPSVAIDPDKEFWVSYRMAVANQKDPAKTLWKKSSLCTKTSINSDLQFMKLSDMLETNAGFVVREMVILDCEILDFRPSFEFSSEQEVLAEVSTDFHGLIDTVTGNKVDIFRKLLATTGCHLNDEDPHPLVTLKENFRMGVGTIAVFLVGFRLDHDDLVKVKHLLCQPGLSRSNGGKVNSRVDESSSNQANLMMKGFNFLQQKIDDLLLDIMVECCQRSSEYSYDASSEPSPDTIGPVCQSESPREFTPGDFIQSLICEGLDNGFVNSTGTCAAECSDKRRSDIPNKAIFGQSVFPPETSAGDHQDFKAIGTFKTKWPEPSVELLGLILDSLKALNGSISQGHPEAGRGTQSAEKISILLDKAPEQLLPDLVKLLPKLVNHSEHRFIACALLDQFRRPDAEPTLLPPVEAVREKLERLGAKVSSSVLDLLSNPMRGEIAEAMLREIDSAFSLDEKCLQILDGSLLYAENGLATKSLDSVDEVLLCTDRHFSDIFILIDMLAIPSLAVAASQVFERGVARGFIVDHSVSMVLEVYLPQRIGVESVSSAEKFQQKGISGKGNMNSLCAEEVFASLLHLAETLSLSRDSRVHGFVKMFYALLFRLFADESYHNRMLKGLVSSATSPSDNSSESYLDILVFLIHVKGGVARPVLGMILKNAAELAGADHAALCDRLCAIEGEISAKQAEISKMVQKLSKSEAATEDYKSKLRLEMDHFAQEKKELSKQKQAAENQCKQFCSKLDEETRKLSKEKKVFQDQLCEVKTLLSQLKSGNCDELKKAVEEKNVLAEKLKSAEAERERFGKELKSAEVAAKEESLLDEIRQLKQDVQRIEGEKLEKEEEFARCQAYTQELEANLNAWKQHTQSLQVALNKEMSMHAPLYGVGLESLSPQELKTISDIHEAGLRGIHALLHRVSSPGGDPILSVNTHQNFDGMHPTALPMADRPPTSDKLIRDHRRYF